MIDQPVPGLSLEPELAEKLSEFLDDYIEKHPVSNGKTALYWHLVSTLQSHTLGS